MKQALKIFSFWKPGLWLIIICYGLFIPASELPTRPFINIPHFDKMVHFALFFVLTILFFKPFKKIQLNPYYFAPAIAVFLGLLLESTQHLISSSRSSNVFDFAANVTGVAVAVIFYHFLISGKKWEPLF